MIKRVLQFFKNIAYGFMKPDEKLVRSILSERENILFRSLKKSEQIHSELVLKAFMKSSENEIPKAQLKAVLLHDIGKTERPLHLIEKSLAVLLHKAGLSDRAYFRNRSFMMSYLHHAERGADLLLSRRIFTKGSTEELLVRTHHENLEDLEKRYEKNHPLLELHKLLKQADDSY